MKKEIVVIALGFMMGLLAAVAVASELKQICSDVKDQAGHVVLNKDGTAQQTCRTVRIHKKYEGTAVPTTNLMPGGFDLAVQKRQRELIAAGARITADGITGPGTRRAEIEFGHLVPKK